MKPGTRHLPLVAAAVAIGVLALGGPAEGQGTNASIVAKDNFFRSVPDGPPVVEIVTGGTVSFAQAGAGAHNVKFTELQPSSCTQSVGTSSGPLPPLPNPASSAAWAGECTFNAPGRYDFVCEIHGFSGGVGVVSPGSQIPPPPPPPPPPPGAPPGPPPPPSAGSTTSAAASSLRLSARQRGTKVKGSLRLAGAGSRLLARAFARRRSLSGGRSLAQVQVGRQLRSSVGPGRVSFSVALNAASRRALRRNGRLAITLRLTVTPRAGGKVYKATRTVTMRRA